MGASHRRARCTLFRMAVSAMIYQRRHALEMRDRIVRLMPMAREPSRWQRFARPPSWRRLLRRLLGEK
jgi:hypothetical protein